MATLIQSYEQQYSVLTAEITSKIGRLKVGDDGKYFHTEDIFLGKYHSMIYFSVTMNFGLHITLQIIATNYPERYNQPLRRPMIW